MDADAPLTNVERRENVLFLVDRYAAGDRRPATVLDADDEVRFRSGDAAAQQRLFFKLLCFGALSAQPAPEALVLADWRRLTAAGLVDDVFDRAFDVRRFAVAAPVTRTDSRGRVIDFVRLSEARDLWSRLLPQPAEPGQVVDLLYACSGGALKSRAFWVVREMLRHGLWTSPCLGRCACVPDGRVRKRAARMGLVDLPEKADTIDDMKAVSAGLHAVMGLAGAQARRHFDLPVSCASQRCEVCDGARMATCDLPHCGYRRRALSA